MSKMITLDLLAEKFESAFGSVPYPGDDNILYEFNKREYGGINPLRVIGTKNWRYLIDQYDGDKNYISLPYIFDLTDEAFHYYLPGYMMVMAKYFNYCNVSANIIDDLLLYSETSDKAYLNKKNLKRFEMLSADQKHAVRLFLEYLIQEYSEQMKFDHPDSAWMALEQYWKRF